MLDLKELIKQLPDILQNKIFYFITIHPVAIAFKKDYTDSKYYINFDLQNN